MLVYGNRNSQKNVLEKLSSQLPSYLELCSVQADLDLLQPAYVPNGPFLMVWLICNMNL